MSNEKRYESFGQTRDRGTTGNVPGYIGVVDTDLWVLNLKITTVTSLYTGENKLEFKEKRIKDYEKASLLPARQTTDGFAAVNISGMIRSMGEKIYKDEGTCDIGQDARGCKKCIMCDMFGSLGKKGRISIDELRSVKPFKDVTDVAVHPRIDRTTGTIPVNEVGRAVKGASLEVEEINEGVELVGNILIRYPKEKDVDVLDAIFRALEINGIGAWTRRGKGRVKIERIVNKIKWSAFKKMGAEDAKKFFTTETVGTGTKTTTAGSGVASGTTGSGTK